MAPRLASLYRITHCLQEGALPPSMADAHVILVYKPTKDPKSCASYRPIALLNNDLKIQANLLTIRFNPLLPSIIDSDPTGFMAHKSTDINLHRLYTNLHAKYDKGKRVVTSLDVEKVFDTFEWPFLWEILRRMGFPLVFIQWLQIIYSSPTAAIRLVVCLLRLHFKD